MNAIAELPYFPRPLLLEQVLKLFLSGLKQGATLFAPRRQGKTSFVKKELIPSAETANWRVIYLDLWARRGQPDLALVEGLEAQVRKSQGVLGKRFRITKLTAKAKPPGTEFGAEAEPADQLQPEAVLENRLAAALDAIVGDGSRTTLLILDEFQALASTTNDNFVAAFRTALQRHQGKLLVFYTGSSREALNKMFRRQKAPLFESAYPLILPDLQRDFVIDRAEFLKERTGLNVDVDALNAAFDRLGRSPEFLNAIIISLMIAGNNDVEAAMKTWFDGQREEGFGPQIKELKAMDVAVLNMLATPERPKVFSKQAQALVAHHLPEAITIQPAMIQSSIRRLARLALVAPTGEPGDYEIDDRGLLVYLRESQNQAAN